MAFIDLPEHTEEWHRIRSRNIGGSEIASLFGEEEKPDPSAEDVKAGFSDSLFSLHYIKAGIVKPRQIEADRVDAGIYMEPSIAAYAAAKRGWQIVKGRYATDDTTPGMGASLDYEIMDAGRDAERVVEDGHVVRGISGPLVGPGVLQIKNVDAIQYLKKWIDGEPPIYIILQVQHEMACSGYQWAVLAAMVGGNRLRLYFYEARPQIISQIRQRVAEFWARIAEGRPPAADGSDASSYALKELYPVLRNNESDPLDLSGSNEVPVLCSDLEETTSKRLELQKQEESLKNRLKAIMGNSTYARCGSWIIKCSVTPPNPGRPPRPGELIGIRSEVRKYSIKRGA